MADGFLGRWARRKHQAVQGKPPDEPQHGPAAAAPPPSGTSAVPPAPANVTPEQPNKAAAPPPSLDDVRHLTAQSDFTPFMAQDVAPEVKNAAVKKLFADPHYNVMDRLDIYIDDYSKPDPLPLAMLRQMASAKFLNLFDDDTKTTGSAPVRDNANPPDPSAAANTSHANHGVAAPEAVPCPPTIENHADTDLRLQQDDAAGAPGSGRSA